MAVERSLVYHAREWFVIFALMSAAFFLTRWHPSIAHTRRERQTVRCRKHMEVLLEAELNHYRDHTSFTTVQNDLNRYTAYAPHARCPLCGEAYLITITANDVVVACPCPESGHGRKYAPAPPTVGDIDKPLSSEILEHLDSQ